MHTDAQRHTIMDTGKVEFKPEEWAEFGIRDLDPSDYILDRNGVFWKPDPDAGFAGFGRERVRLGRVRVAARATEHVVRHDLYACMHACVYACIYVG